MVRLLIFIVFVFSAFPAWAGQKTFCMFFDRQCHLSRQIDSLEQWKNQPYHKYFEDTFSKVLEEGNEKTKRKMLSFLDRLGKDNQKREEYKMFLYISLGQLPDAINTVKHLQELDGIYAYGDGPQYRVIIYLVEKGKALDALQFAKETQHIEFKNRGGNNINWAREPRTYSMRILVEEFYKNNQLDKVCEFAQLLSEDGIFTDNPAAFIAHIRSSYGINCTIK